jgi:tetratricopeptide (TPR) repeat protein
MIEDDKKRRLKKLVIIVIAIFAALVGASYLVYRLLQSGHMPPMALLVLAAVISIGIPMIRSNFFPSDRDCATEYAFHEQRLEKEMLQHISDSLGPDSLNDLFSQPDQYRASAGDHLEQLLTQENVPQNPDLHFALLLSLARFHEKNGTPRSSIALLKAALEIKPQQFVARMHLAGNYEWIGETEEACRHYRILLDHPETLSGAMKKLVATHLKNVQLK